MSVRKLRNLVTTLWCTLLITGTIPAFANSNADVSDGSQATQAVETNVQAEATDQAAERRKKIMQGAVDAIAQTKNALKSLEEERIDDALESLAIATGKLELIIARDPSMALAPTDVSVATYDIYGSPDAIRSAIKEAEDALEDGDVQSARRLLSGIRSETVITVTNIPIATYPDAIKQITPLIDEGKIEEAKSGLQAALNTLVLTDNIIPLPVVRSEDLLNQAEALTEKADRSDEENQQLADQLAAARDHLEMAEILGYGDKADYKRLYSQLDQIEEKTDDGNSGTGFFENINASMARLWESIIS